MSAWLKSPVVLVGVMLAAAGVAAAAEPTAYDPSALPPGPVVTDLLTVTDPARDREVPIKVYRAGGEPTPRPVLLFSHGLGGSREGSTYLGNHWAGRGYVVVCLQHPGSDTSVWRDVPPRERTAAMRAAASGPNLALRVGDVRAVLDQLARWQDEAGHPLAGRLDLTRVGMSGHSFGAVTTQAVSGQAAAGRPVADEPRIKAAVIMSPSGPRGPGADPAKAFGSVTRPWLLLTGTEDEGSFGGETAEGRLAVFPALAPGRKYELVLDGARHSAFTDARPATEAGRNPAHHRAILAISTAFWDATLRDDAAARAWLDGDGPRSVLAAGDRWQKK